MSISTRLEAINQHLLDDYSVLELGGADLTNVDKNIFNLKPQWQDRLKYYLAHGTDVLWNNWEKVSGSGTEITLNNTMEGKMKVDLKGNTQQNGTPTPDAPQDIQVVSGDNTIKVEGKNLLNANGIYSSTSTTNLQRTYENGIATLIWSNGFNFYMTVDGSNTTPLPIDNTKTYTLSFYHKGDALNLRLDESNTNVITTSTDSDYTRYTYTFTNLSQFIIKFVRKDSTGTAYLKDFQLELGSATTYTPYQSTTYPISLGNIELCKIGTYQDKIAKSTGKNLLSSELETGGISAETGQNSSAGRTRTKDYIDIQPNTEYTLSADYQGWYVVHYYNESQTFISSLANKSNKITFTTPSNAKYLRCVVAITNAPNVMLNTGQTALPYEPYGTSWYLNKQIGKVVLNGSENWYNAGGNAPFGLTLDGALITIGDNILPLIYCDNFQKVTQSASWSSYESMVSTNNVSSATNVLRFRYTSISSIENFQTWLSTHNTTVYYVLATPTYEEITDTTLLSQLEALAYSYDEQTNISQVNDDMPFILDITALKEIS